MQRVKEPCRLLQRSFWRHVTTAARTWHLNRKKKQKWGRRFPQLIRGKKIETIVQEKRCSFTWMYLRAGCIATMFFLQEISSNFLFIVSITKLTNEHPSPIRKVCAFVKTFFVNRFRLKWLSFDCEAKRYSNYQEIFL
jgi:hypothetical protein